MLDVWGCPVVIKTTPGGRRCRVAFGPGTGEPVPPEGWEMRTTHPDDDYSYVTFSGTAPGWPGWEEHLANPEAYWADQERALLECYDGHWANQ